VSRSQAPRRGPRDPRKGDTKKDRKGKRNLCRSTLIRKKRICDAVLVTGHKLYQSPRKRGGKAFRRDKGGKRGKMKEVKRDEGSSRGKPK